MENVARWVGKMLRMFGLGEGESYEIGWGQETNGEGAAVDVWSFFPFTFLVH